MNARGEVVFSGSQVAFQRSGFKVRPDHRVETQDRGQHEGGFGAPAPNFMREVQKTET